MQEYWVSLYYSSHKRKVEEIKKTKKWKEGRIVLNMRIMCEGNKLGMKENLRREKKLNLSKNNK
jgi:hypothetical protein